MGLFIQEAASVYVGDDAPDNLKQHNLDSVTLPTYEEVGEAHHAGGAWGEIEWGNLGMKALKPSFKVKGHDPQVMSQIAKRQRIPWTIYGLLRDKKLETPIQVKAIIFARLSKAAPDA